MGKNLYMQAALRSLPFEEQGPSSGADDAPLGPMRKVERQLAEALLQQVSSWQESAATTLQQDEERLAVLLGPDVEVDGRLIAAVQYRIERKKLLLAAAAVLKAYLRSG